MANKPTGMIGPFSVMSSEEGITAGWQRIDFPKKKEDIENLIVDMWASATKQAGGTIYEVIRNDENDFDFTLELPGGTVSLDLVEFIYGDGQKRPYEGEEIEINSYLYAEQITALVEKKSRHYGKSKHPIDLLVYITHWRFWADEIAIRLAQHMISLSSPVFENVFFVQPFNTTEGNVRVLYPSRDPLEGLDPSVFKNHYYWTPNPANMEVATYQGEPTPKQ